MNEDITYVGLDAHQETIHAGRAGSAVLFAGARRRCAPETLARPGMRRAHGAGLNRTNAGDIAPLRGSSR
jgi:hypothetical protein